MESLFKEKKFFNQHSNNKGGLNQTKKFCIENMLNNKPQRDLFILIKKRKDKRKNQKIKRFNLRREHKLTISRAMNVEEFEIKQRSLASVKRARLKEKKFKNRR